MENEGARARLTVRVDPHIRMTAVTLSGRFRSPMPRPACGCSAPEPPAIWRNGFGALRYDVHTRATYYQDLGREAAV